MDNKSSRERLGSRLGFILLSAGCAIGIGNVWKFPTITGQNGGGFFVLIYLLFLVIMGIPVMTMEFAMGRASQKSPVRMYHELTPDKKKWRAHSYMCLAGNVILMMFYTSVAGWMLQYFIYTATGKFEAMNTAAEVSGVFGEMLSNPLVLTIFVAVVVIIGFGVCSFSLQKGLEKVTKVMMIALLGIMVVLVINGFFLDGAAEGLKFYLLPNINNLLDQGVFNVIVAAMNQAFFTLSLGVGSMAIFGSFIEKDRALMGESVNIAILDTCVAVMSGLIIFPACFTYDVEVTAGPSLIFQTLPHVFNNMAGGRIFGSLFFIFMSFAALSTVLAVFQNILSCTQELFGWGKKLACLIDGVVMFILALPCVLGFNVWANAVSLGKLTSILDLEDYLVSNIILPVGALIFIIYCTNKRGWNWDNFVAEANTGKGLKVRSWMRVYMKYILPLIVGVILVIGVVTPFI